MRAKLKQQLIKREEAILPLPLREQVRAIKHTARRSLKKALIILQGLIKEVLAGIELPALIKTVKITLPILRKSLMLLMMLI